MEFPDFDKMTPEEQMAWLESLARRQGAKDEELTTAADLEIAIPEDAVVDEPGYVPFFERERSARAQEAEPAPQPSASEEPETGEPVDAYAGQAPEQHPGAESVAEAAASAPQDPMQWLDSLTPHVEGEADEFDFAFDLDAEEEPEPLPFERAELEPPEPAEPPRPAAVPQPAETQESEAAEEFDIDAFFLEATGTTESSPPEDVDDLLQGADPMRWLESLAVRQGASTEELTTPADMEIPEVPEGTVVDEPGYVPFDVTGGTREPETVLRMSVEAEPEPEQEAFAAPVEAAPYGAAQAPESSGLLDEMDESLAWLRDLAQDPSEADVAQMLDIDREYLGAAEAEAVAAAALPAEPPEAADPLAGLSDEEIAALQARGELTGEQELAWLQRQAEKLAEARRLEAEQSAEDVEAAEPAELPDWLEEMREEAAQEAAAAPEAEVEDLFEEIALEELPDWLAEPEVASAAEALAPELEALWEPETAAEVPSETGEPTPEAIEAFLQDQAAPPDALAEALDEEYERQIAGEDTEPEWYAEAVAQVEETIEADAAMLPDEPELQEAVPVDLPDWLQEPVGEGEAEAEAMPDWLMEPEAARDAEPSGPPAEQPQVPPSPVPPPAPAPALVAALPDDPRFEPYRERLTADPADHVSRLSLARALREYGNPRASLPHYEVLVESTELLDEVSKDLTTLAAGPEADADVHRILGDAYMRQGKLQQALDAYRTALEQL